VGILKSYGLATATAAAREENSSDYSKPKDFIVKKTAKTVIHSITFLKEKTFKDLFEKRFCLSAIILCRNLPNVTEFYDF
jgi:hypothetical protein